MKASIVLALLAVHAGAVASAADEGTYLACSGTSGLSPKQDLVPLLDRSITANEDTVKGSFFIGTDKLVVEGITWMLGEFAICENSNQKVVFSPGCYAPNPDVAHDYGILNKVTGDVRYHAGDMLFVLTCKQATRILK